MRTRRRTDVVFEGGTRVFRRPCRSIGLALALWLLAVFGYLPVLAREDGSRALVDLQILQTTDIHGYLRGCSKEDDPCGGWLRAATLIKRLRERHGSERTLLIDCGDTIQGSYVATVCSGAFVPAALQSLAYDVWVPGNHELDFGLSVCADVCSSAGDIVLCGNLSIDTSGGMHRYRAWRLFERQGVRVAVIGATASHMPHWFWGKRYAGMRTGSAMSMLKRIMGEVLGAKPDVIVLACHQGWLPNDVRKVNEVGAIADEFPEIDVILGGHTHRPFPGRKIGWHTWYVQAGQHGQYVAEVHVQVNTAANRVEDVSSVLVPVNAAVPVDPELERTVSPWLEMADRKGREVIASLAVPLSGGGTPGRSCHTSELLCRVLSEAADADVVLHGRLSRAGLPRGPVTERDLFAVVPYENTVVVMELTLEQLAHVVSEQVANRTSYVYCGLWGAHAIATRDGTVTITDVGGRSPSSLGSNHRIRVALNSYTAAGGGGRFPVLRRYVDAPASRAVDTGISTRDAARSFLAAHPELDVHPQQWLRFERKPRTRQ